VDPIRGEINAGDNPKGMLQVNSATAGVTGMNAAAQPRRLRRPAISQTALSCSRNQPVASRPFAFQGIDSMALKRKSSSRANRSMFIVGKRLRLRRTLFGHEPDRAGQADRPHVSAVRNTREDNWSAQPAFRHEPGARCTPQITSSTRCPMISARRVQVSSCAKPTADGRGRKDPRCGGRPWNWSRLLPDRRPDRPQAVTDLVRSLGSRRGVADETARRWETKQRSRAKAAAPRTGTKRNRSARRP